MGLGYFWFALAAAGISVSVWTLYKNLTSEEALEEMEAEALIPFYEAFHRINLWKIFRDEQVAEVAASRIDIIAMASKWDNEFSCSDEHGKGSYHIGLKRS